MLSARSEKCGRPVEPALTRPVVVAGDLDGGRYAIDLCPAHARALRAWLDDAEGAAGPVCGPVT